MKWPYVVAVLAMVGFALSDKRVRALVMVPRGIRNNNPGNVRHGSNWQGMAPVQTDADFVQFIDPVYGVRALAKVLRTYRDAHGIRTVRGIIERWAPPVGQDASGKAYTQNTGAYVQSVAGKLGVNPDAPLSFSGEQVQQLVTAIIKHENGRQPYDAAVIRQGVSLAGWA